MCIDMAPGVIRKLVVMKKGKNQLAVVDKTVSVLVLEVSLSAILCFEIG